MKEIVSLQDIQKEAAKAFGKETASQIFSFLSDITRPPAKELGGLLADYMRCYRFKTQMMIIKYKPKKSLLKHCRDYLKIVLGKKMKVCRINGPFYWQIVLLMGKIQQTIFLL